MTITMRAMTMVSRPHDRMLGDTRTAKTQPSPGSHQRRVHASSRSHGVTSIASSLSTVDCCSRLPPNAKATRMDSAATTESVPITLKPAKPSESATGQNGQGVNRLNGFPL